MADLWDLHCHFVPGVDDGARTLEEGAAILRGLRSLGFTKVIATPHMRPGLFDNTAEDLREAYALARGALSDAGLPGHDLSCEHYFDDVVFQRVMGNRALPYPGGKAVLLEFYEIDFPHTIDHRLADVRRRGLVPVVAHPERYQAIWRNPEILERLVDVGAAALLDVAALVGKYGRRPQRTAEELLKKNLYHAACSDVHRPEDIEPVKQGMDRLQELYGPEEVEFLFGEGPRALLEGRVPR